MERHNIVDHWINGAALPEGFEWLAVDYIKDLESQLASAKNEIDIWAQQAGEHRMKIERLREALKVLQYSGDDRVREIAEEALKGKE